MIYRNKYLAHHGILGQRWGIRRFQDKSGRLTSAGKKRYDKDGKQKTEEDGEKKPFWTDERKATAKKIAIGAAFIAGTALVAYGGYKMYQNGKFDPIIDKISQRGKNVASDILGFEDPVNNQGHQKLAKNIGAKFNPDFELTSETIESTIEKVNPSGSRDNCGACVTSSLLNSCGFNTSAVEHIPKELTNGGLGLDPNKVKDIWKGVGEFNHLDDIEGSRKTIVSNIISKLDESTEPGGGGRVYVLNSVRAYRDMIDNYNKLSPQQRDSLSQKQKDNIKNAMKIVSGEKKPPGHYFEYFKDANGKIGFKDGQPNGGIYHYDVNEIIETWFGSGKDLSTIEWTNDIITGIKNGTIQPDPEMIKALLASF